MLKRMIAALLTAVGAGAVWTWWQQRRTQRPVVGRVTEEAPASATSLSAQPHKRVRIARPVAPELENRPLPDSAEGGRTPYYFVPGEALLTLYGDSSASDTVVAGVAAQFGGQVLPMGAANSVHFPIAERPGTYTVVRLYWEADSEYEATLSRFRLIEAQVNQAVREGEYAVTAWMPNWIGTTAAVAEEQTMLFTPGGPGAYPQSATAPIDGTLPLKTTPFLAEWRAQASHPVTLAVLDAFPDAAELTDADSLPATLTEAVRQLRQASTPLTLANTAHYATFRDGHPFDMRSHGLMTTWLAMEILGEAARTQVTVEPIRVATAAGVCSVADVLAGMSPLTYRVRQGEKIVAVLAFVVGMGDIIPPRLRDFEEHYEALRLCLLAFSEAGGILLGAAGNDASGLQHPPRTRIPASFRSVIEVSAGQYDQNKLALYANQSKALCLFAGEANIINQMTSNLPRLVGPALPRTADETTTTGWVAWAGTSFAAALAAGLAVLKLSAQPELKMWDIRTALRDIATETRNPGNVPFVDLVESV